MGSGKRGKYAYDFPRPAVTVDVIALSDEAWPHVLLIRRKHEPFADCWALPGGFVEMEEGLEAAARRELLEETGLTAKRLIQLHTFGDPGRDPRGRTISVVYLTRVSRRRARPQAADDAAAVAWYPLRKLPRLAFDHARILALVRKRLAT
jgi:8-oxo-dGTP diphosphatase